MLMIPGLQGLVDKVPELATPRGFLRALLTAVGVCLVALVVLLVAEGWAPWIGLVAQLLLYVALFWLVRSFFTGRAARLTYTDAFFGRFMPAAGLNGASLLYIWLNGGGVTDPDALTRLFPTIVGGVIAVYFFLTAVVVFVRAMQVAGVDTLAGLYIYYPDEGRMYDDGIYRVVRHPVYASIDRVALGLAFVNGSTYALLLAVIFVGVWHPIWIAVEERELVHRMGERYASSMRRVPAIWPQGFSGEAKLWQVLTGRDVMSGLPVDVDDEGGRPPSDLPPAGA